ncbi:hypothetical protein [Herbidospora daliensis]|uniref:hypothetical protein n=1 Tax=Herbidospora daliensis TaxID=295585 RepID=UPI0007834F6F|nr:hypothetical protein [Herbidospora daliensis]
MPTNEVSGGYTPIMVGRVVGKSQPDLDDEQETPETEEPSPRGRTRNVVTGNAKVGVQADVIHGGVNVVMW